MADIITFPSARQSQEEEPKGEWLQGPVRCLCCQHQWHGVAEVGTGPTQCPVCGVFRGVFLYAPSRPEEDHYRCNCGSECFSITRARIYCTNCGKTHRPWD